MVDTLQSLLYYVTAAERQASVIFLKEIDAYLKNVFEHRQDYFTDNSLFLDFR